jgi:hypothetical protein
MGTTSDGRQPDDPMFNYRFTGNDGLSLSKSVWYDLRRIGDPKEISCGECKWTQ